MLYAAIDIHKHVFQAAVLDPESGEVVEERFSADRESLARWADRWRGRLEPVAIEATTGWRGVWRELVAKGFEVRLAEPLQARALLSRRRSAKTDRLDARELEDRELERLIRHVFCESRETYGASAFEFSRLGMADACGGRVRGVIPVADPERSLDGVCAVAAAGGDEVDGVFLFERESGRERAEPARGPGERGAATKRVGVAWEVVEELAGAPGDAAAGPFGERLPGVGAVPADVLARILRRLQTAGIDDPNCGRLLGANGLLDRAHRGAASGGVVVEAERHRLDAKPCETFELFRSAARAAERADVLYPVRSQQMDVEHAFDEHQLAPKLMVASEDRREPVRSQAAAGCASQVEVAAAVGVAVVDRARPQRLGVAAFVVPAADDSSCPAGVCEHTRAAHLLRRVAEPLQRFGERTTVRHHAEPRVENRPGREAAPLEVFASLGAALARELAPGEHRHVVEWLGTPVARFRSIERGRGNACALGEIAHSSDEIAASRRDATVDVHAPQDGLAAVDQEPARRWPVRDDPVGPYAECPVCELLVAGDPAVPIALPAELRERRVEPLLQRGQDDIGVEVARVEPLHLPSASLEAALAQIGVDRRSRDLTDLQFQLRRPHPQAAQQLRGQTGRERR